MGPCHRRCLGVKPWTQTTNKEMAGNKRHLLLCSLAVFSLMVTPTLCIGIGENQENANIKRSLIHSLQDDASGIDGVKSMAVVVSDGSNVSSSPFQSNRKSSSKTKNNSNRTINDLLVGEKNNQDPDPATRVVSRKVKVQAPWDGKGVNSVIIPASFDMNYTESVNISSQLIFIYNYTQTNQTTAVRIHVSCDSVSDTHPVMFAARQQEGILAWSVPLNTREPYSYTAVSRTLCPINKRNREGMDEPQYIFLQVSSHTPTNVAFHLTAKLIKDFQLSHRSPREVSVVTAQPKYYVYMFPDGVDQVLLRVRSESKTCMIVSVQEIKCPVRDLENNIAFEGKHQTMTTQAALFLQRSDFDDIKGFYLVLLVRSNDEKCSGKYHWYDINPAQEIKDRSKSVKISIKEATGTNQYVVATMTAVGVLLGFYVLAFLMGLLYNSCGSHKVLDDLTSEERADVTDRSFYQARPAEGAYGSLDRGQETEERFPPKEMGAVARQVSQSKCLLDTASLNEEEIDFLPDAESEKDIYRSKKTMYVSDLARKKPTKLRRYYNQYIWNLVSLAIFYALPVVQLVLTYQSVLLQSGNEDLCYYNFDCANPLKSYLSSFNNVFSNIGYVMLGFLFILIVRSRDILQTRAMEQHKDLVPKLGIPQHYGIFYAMGFALVMEGVMSGCYHVCPNYSNFQFDTSFMYIIACLCMLRIYQNRHPDISAKSHTAYFSMAFIILIAVIGVIYSTNIFWIFYALVHMFITVFLSAQVYFMGRWKIGWSSFKRFTLFLINDCRRRSLPVSPNRFIMLVIGNAINWTFALYGAITRPSDFASYLLAIFIGNLLLYCLFYIMMKLLSGERISLLVVAVMLTSMVTWGCSLYFFFQHVTSWQKTPSGSREGNMECILFDFYDSHDVWHFLSAFSLFFSFMILLLLDDNVALKPRNQIPVF